VQYLAMFDLANVVLLLGVNYVIAAWHSGRAEGRQPQITPGYIARSLLRSVPLLTYVAAVALNLTGLRLPGPLGVLAESAARANMPVVFLLLGVYLEFGLPRRELAAAGKTLILRYAVGLSLGFAAYLLLPFDEAFRKVLLVALILPVGTIVTPFAAAFGLNRRLAALATNASLILSFLLLWVVAAVL
jgi:predicted permease